jgi:drug/metabolite transporter (DMT)-like permease
MNNTTKDMLLKSRAFPLILLIALGFIWGSGYTLAKFAVTHGVSPLGYAFWQSLGPAILVTLFVFFSKDRFIWDKVHLRYYAVTGFLGIALPNTNMYIVAAHLPAGLLAIIVNTVPILTYPLALLWQLERFSWLRFCGVIIGFSGIVCIVLPSTLGLTTLSTANGWAALALLSPLSFSLAALYIHKKRPVETSAISLTAGMLCLSTVFLLPLMLYSHSFYPLTRLNAPELVVILEIILSSIGYIVFFILIRRAGAVYYSLVGGIVALTGLFWGFCIYNETLSLRDIYATALILAALVLLSVKASKKTAL